MLHEQMGGRVWAAAVPPGRLLFSAGKSPVRAVAQAGVLPGRGEQTQKLPYMISPLERDKDLRCIIGWATLAA